ncbi:MAG: nucleotidyl transferase AbiEii/AbiGii toxin family protein [Sphaerochaeta sp.]
MFREEYLEQVKLLVKVLPSISKETCFTLKGGAAINLFVRNLPRLSVDIDLTYVGFENRGVAIHNSNASLDSIGECQNPYPHHSSVDFVEVLPGTYFRKIMLWTPYSAIPVEIVEVLTGTCFQVLRLRGRTV